MTKMYTYVKSISIGKDEKNVFYNLSLNYQIYEKGWVIIDKKLFDFL